MAVITTILVGWLSPAEANPVSIPVDCKGSQVGTIDVDVSPATATHGEGVAGAFNIGFVWASLGAVAAFCGEDHFNWYQIFQYDSEHPSAPQPDVDPPIGGTTDNWADNLPWFWDETVPNPIPPNYHAIYQLSAHTHPFSLDYNDFPVPSPGQFFDIITLLVSLDKSGGFVDFHGGFEYFANGGAGGATTITNLGVYVAPEPQTLALTVTGAISLFVWRRRRLQLLQDQHSPSRLPHV
jgi:hypothetical protein